MLSHSTEVQFDVTLGLSIFNPTTHMPRSHRGRQAAWHLNRGGSSKKYLGGPGPSPFGRRQRAELLCPMSSIKQLTGWAKKLHTAFFAITLPTLNQFSEFLACINRRRFATGRCIVSPPTTIYVTTLPCESLIATLFMFLYQTVNLLLWW